MMQLRSGDRSAAAGATTREGGSAVTTGAAPQLHVQSGGPGRPDVEERVLKYRKGETVIYPHHGACIVQGVTPIEVAGEKQDFLVLQSVANDLKVSVPVARIDELGIRSPLAADELDDLVEVLQRRDVRVPANWSRRLKNHQEKLKSGDVYQVAEVVRNLAIRSRTSELSVAEKDMFRHARENLVHELAPSMGASVEDASAFLDKVLEGEEAEAKS